MLVELFVILNNLCVLLLVLIDVIYLLTFPLHDARVHCQVELTGSDVFQVQAGDRYGFSWLNYGVIDFDYVSNDNYCESSVKQDVGSTVNLLENRHGKRDYSIRMLLSTCPA